MAEIQDTLEQTSMIQLRSIKHFLGILLQGQV